MPGKRLKDPSLQRTWYEEVIQNEGLLLTDWDGLVEARPIPLKLVGNSWFQGSYDGITWENLIQDDHAYARLSTDGGIEWIIFNMASCVAQPFHPPLTLSVPNGLSLDVENQVLSLNFVDYTTGGAMLPYDKWKLDQLKLDYLTNLPGGVGIYKNYVDQPDGLTRIHNLLPLVEGANITIEQVGDTIVISSLAEITGVTSGGHNDGTLGVGVFDRMSAGPTLEFRHVATTGDIITINLDDVNNNILFEIVEANIDHNVLENYVPNEHIDHSLVKIIGEEGVTTPGFPTGKDLTSNILVALAFDELTSVGSIDPTDVFSLYNTADDLHYKITWSDIVTEILQETDPRYVPITRAVNTGNGLRGGGVLSVDRTINLAFNDLPTITFDPATDYFAIYDASTGTHGKILVSAVNSVNITEGNGMDFDPITGAGPIHLALPLTVTDSTNNSAGAVGAGHTHTLSIAQLISIVDVDNSPVSGEYLKWTGTTWITDDPTIGASTPGMPLNSIQFNDNNTFAGNAGLLYDPAQDVIFFSPQATTNANLYFGENTLFPSIHVNNTGSVFEIINPVEYGSVSLEASQVQIGNASDSNSFLIIQDTNTTELTNSILVYNQNFDELLKLTNSGQFYLSQLDSAVGDNVLYFDTITGKITYGAKPTNGISGIQTLTADIQSGLTVNGGSSSSAAVIDLDVNDSRLIEATIALEDYIGFWDITGAGAYKQRKTTLANFPGWNFYVDNILRNEIKFGDRLGLVAGNNVTLSYANNNVTINASGGDGVGDYPDLYVDGQLMEEDFPTLNVIAGQNITVDYSAPGGVTINANPYFPPYTHLPNALIAFNRDLYTYDISEGTAVYLPNAPNSAWNTHTSFGEGAYVYTSSGTTVFRYDIVNDITISVEAADSNIMYLVNATDGIYVISSNSCYHIDKADFTVRFYGNSRATTRCVGAIETYDPVTAKTYILLYNDEDNRFYYKETRQTYTGAASDMFVMSVKFLDTSLFVNWRMSSLVSQNNTATNGGAFSQKFMLVSLDHQSFVFDDIHKFIGNSATGDSSFADSITFPYTLPSNKPTWSGDEDEVRTVEITNTLLNSKSYAAVIANGYAASGIDTGLYISTTADIFESDSFEQVLNEYVYDISVEHVLTGPFEYKSYTIVGGYRLVSGSVVGRVSFRMPEEDPKQFVTKDVYSLDNSKTHATLVTSPISFVYYKNAITDNGNPNPKEIVVTGQIDLYVDDILKEEGVDSLNFVSGTGINLEYDTNGKVTITSPITITNVTAGNGMDFVDNTPVTLGTPSTIDSTTTNTVTETSHTHELGNINMDNVVSGVPVEYGALYNWYAATNARKISSSDDWVVPTDVDIVELAQYIDNTYVSGNYSLGGGKLKEIGTTYWNSPNTGATNELGFNARGGGSRDNSDGNYYNLKSFGFFWNSVESDSPESGYCFSLANYDSNLGVAYLYLNKKIGASIRLLYTGAGTPTTYTGNDGKVYPVVLIGTQYWISCNLNETKYRNGDWITGFDNGVYTPISNSAWAALTTEAMCYYDDNEAYGGGEIPLETIIPVVNSNYLKDWIEFEFRDIEAGTATDYILDLKALVGYTIDSAVMQIDDGTLTIAIKIGTTDVTSLSAIVVDTNITETTSTGTNTVVPGDKILLTLSTNYTGSPTLIRGKLNLTRT